MTSALELWDKLRQQPHSWLPTGQVFPFVLTPNERETVLAALRSYAAPEDALITELRQWVKNTPSDGSGDPWDAGYAYAGSEVRAILDKCGPQKESP